MRERLERMLGTHGARDLDPHLSRRLRPHAPRARRERLGYRSNFTIYDSADQVRVVKACLEDLGRDPKRFTPRGIHSQISNAKNQLIGPDEYMAASPRSTTRRWPRCTSSTSASSFVVERRRLRRHADADGRGVRALPGGAASTGSTRSATSSSTSTRTRTTRSTGCCSCSPESTGTCSRSETPTSRSTASAAPTSRTSSTSSRTFPGARSIALEQNYRSTNAILGAANAVIENNRDRKPKRLFSELGEGEPVQVVEVEDEHAEARFVAAEIARLVGEGWSASEIARLLPHECAVAACSRTCSCARTIPYQVIGGPRFYERAEIKDAVAYLSVLDNPSDAVSLMRIANRPRRGIGDTSLQRLVTRADALGISLWEAMADPDAAGIGTAAREGGAGLPHDDGVAAGLRAGARRRRAARGRARAQRHDRGVEAERTIEARGRIENLAGARRRRAGVRPASRTARSRRSPTSCRASRSSPTRTRSRERAIPRHADDDPQRERARVPRRLPDRHGGGDLPALPLDRGATRSRRSAGSPTSA